MTNKKDPFRPAERATPCPNCGEFCFWNVEDRLSGNNCVSCGRTFTGHERNTVRNPFNANTGSTLMTYTIGGVKYKAHPECRSPFREDRRNGLIYGPYRHTEADGTKRWLSGPEEASMLWSTCAYCGKG